MGVVVLKPTPDGTTGRGIVPATPTLMGMHLEEPHHWGACVCACVGWRGQGEASARIGGGTGREEQVGVLFGFWSKMST